MLTVLTPEEPSGWADGVNAKPGVVTKSLVDPGTCEKTIRATATEKRLIELCMRRVKVLGALKLRTWA